MLFARLLNQHYRRPPESDPPMRRNSKKKLDAEQFMPYKLPRSLAAEIQPLRRISAFAPESFNGRTTGSDPVNLGSNPGSGISRGLVASSSSG